MKVYFFQPGQFNRTPQKTNPFFDPIIDVCKKHGITYRVWCMERHPGESGYGAHWGLSSCLFIYDIIALRFIKWFHLPERPVFKFFGWIANVLTLGRYRADICITVAGVHLELLQGIAPHARLVDLQHGVIGPGHEGYFENVWKLKGRLRNNLQREYWLYGEGFKSLFLREKDNRAFLKDRLYVIGDVLELRRGSGRSSDLNQNLRKSIVFSLQYTNSLSIRQMDALTDGLKSILQQIETMGIHRHYQVLFKHHPRYENCYDLTTLLERFPWVKVTCLSMNELVGMAFYHITAYSTTAFEYAAAGVPTMFYWDVVNPEGKRYFYDTFSYPIPSNVDIMFSLMNDCATLCRCQEKVKKWYRRFYCRFSESKLERLLNISSR